jgi:hypothetical protein
MEYFHISTSDNSCRGPPGLPRGPPETKFPLTTRRVLVCFLRARATSSLRHAILVCQTPHCAHDLAQLRPTGTKLLCLALCEFPETGILPCKLQTQSSCVSPCVYLVSLQLAFPGRNPRTVRRQCRGGLGIEIPEFRNCNPSPLEMIRLHPIYMITGDPHALLRATRAVYTPRGRYTRPGYETTVVA